MEVSGEELMDSIKVGITFPKPKMYQFEMIIFIAFKALLSLFNDLIRGESK
jgi:hypothetical protein